MPIGKDDDFEAEALKDKPLYDTSNKQEVEKIDSNSKESSGPRKEEQQQNLTSVVKKENAEPKSAVTFNDLSLEIFRLILQFTDGVDILKLRTVSKKWHKDLSPENLKKIEGFLKNFFQKNKIENTQLNKHVRSLAAIAIQLGLCDFKKEESEVFYAFMRNVCESFIPSQKILGKRKLADFFADQQALLDFCKNKLTNLKDKSLKYNDHQGVNELYALASNLLDKNQKVLQSFIIKIAERKIDKSELSITSFFRGQQKFTDLLGGLTDSIDQDLDKVFTFLIEMQLQMTKKTVSKSDSKKQIATQKNAVSTSTAFFCFPTRSGQNVTLCSSGILIGIGAVMETCILLAPWLMSSPGGTPATPAPNSKEGVEIFKLIGAVFIILGVLLCIANICRCFFNQNILFARAMDNLKQNKNLLKKLQNSEPESSVTITEIKDEKRT